MSDTKSQNEEACIENTKGDKCQKKMQKTKPQTLHLGIIYLNLRKSMVKRIILKEARGKNNTLSIEEQG